MQGIEIEEGEFKGWTGWPDEPFEFFAAGPFYLGRDDRGPLAAFRAADKHLNAVGVVHGGCLMTFADFAIFALAQDQLSDSYGVTVSFASEFLSGVRVGELVEARGEVLHAGGSLLFFRGLVAASGRPCLNFSATIKRIRGTGKSLAPPLVTLQEKE